jgi:hypothetical protein
LVDVFTTYGTVLFWPHPRRYAWDAVPIVDLFFCGALLVALVLGAVWRARPGRVAAAGAAALGFLALYAGYGLYLTARVERAARRQLEGMGRRPADVHAYPVLLLPWLRRVVVGEGPGQDVGWMSAWRPRDVQWYTLPSARGPLVDEARQLEDVRMFEWVRHGADAADRRARRRGTSGSRSTTSATAFPTSRSTGSGACVAFDYTGARAGGAPDPPPARPPAGTLLRWLCSAPRSRATRDGDAAGGAGRRIRARGGRRQRAQRRPCREQPWTGKSESADRRRRRRVDNARGAAIRAARRVTTRTVAWLRASWRTRRRAAARVAGHQPEAARSGWWSRRASAQRAPEALRANGSPR